MTESYSEINESTESKWILSKMKFLRRKVDAADDYLLLLLEVPRTNDKKALAAERMLAALHGILRPKRELRLSGTLQEYLSFEIVAIKQRISFYIWTPRHLQTFVEAQIYAHYPNVRIYEQPVDYSKRALLDQAVIHCAELTLADNEIMPIKTFQSFDADPLATIMTPLAMLNKDNEQMWIQIMARPISDNWQQKGTRVINRIKGQRRLFTGSGGAKALNYAGQAFAALVRPPAASSRGGTADPELSEPDKARIAAIKQKTSKPGYRVKIRLLYYGGNDQRTARLRIQTLASAFKHFNTIDSNGFILKNSSFRKDKLLEYQARFFIDKGFILNIEELASLFHLPHTSIETSNIVWASPSSAKPLARQPIDEPSKQSESPGLNNGSPSIAKQPESADIAQHQASHERIGKAVTTYAQYEDEASVIKAASKRRHINRKKPIGPANSPAADPKNDQTSPDVEYVIKLH